MAIIKVACPGCGQRFSGDESFFGRVITCQLCGGEVVFPSGIDDDGADTATRDREPAPADAPSEKSEKPAEKKVAEKAAKPAQAPKPRAKKASAGSRAAAPVMAAPKKALVGRPARPQAAAGAGTGPAITSSAAIWSLICGLATFAFCPVGFIFAIPAVFLGHIGRGAVDRSLGKIGGGGYATGGMMLGYGYVVLVLALVLFAPWKPFATFGFQRYNEQATVKVLEALDRFAEENEDRYPGQLSDLVPGYLSAGEFEGFKWLDPGSVPVVKQEDYVYFGGHSRSDDGQVILIAAPRADDAYRRFVGRVDGSVANLDEEEYLRQAEE